MRICTPLKTNTFTQVHGAPLFHSPGQTEALVPCLDLDSREVELGAMDLFMDLTPATLDSLTPHAPESKGVWQSIRLAVDLAKKAGRVLAVGEAAGLRVDERPPGRGAEPAVVIDSVRRGTVGARLQDRPRLGCPGAPP